MMGNRGIPNPGICQRLLLQNEHDYGQQLYFCYSPRKSDVVATAVPFFLGGKVRNLPFNSTLIHFPYGNERSPEYWNVDLGLTKNPVSLVEMMARTDHISIPNKQTRISASHFGEMIHLVPESVSSFKFGSRIFQQPQNVRFFPLNMWHGMFFFRKCKTPCKKPPPRWSSIFVAQNPLLLALGIQTFIIPRALHLPWVHSLKLQAFR